ncbi:MAG: response regulator [Candidatus Omnitrophica bacterium]|nr:response regulator [Candidatus Omnitrophota bacterium]
MPKKILIVDDEPDLLRVTTFRLKKAGYEISSATNGQEALDLIRANPPDLVLLDLRLPLIDGYEVCRQVKSDPGLKHVPVILFTASIGHDISETVKKVMADDYVIKPFEPDDLLSKIKKLIGFDP